MYDSLVQKEIQNPQGTMLVQASQEKHTFAQSNQNFVGKDN